MKRQQEDQSLEDWRESVFPNDLGDDNHRWSWLMSASDGSRNIMFLHKCKDGKWSTNWIDISSGTRHQLISEDPLHVEASIACPIDGCSDHGWIRNGRWENAG